MGLFEDIKNAEMVCGDEIRQLKAELATFKMRFATLNGEYQSALDIIETLKSEQIAMEELEHAQKQKAAITANRNHWKRECEAMGMLYKLTDEELQELKQEKTAQNQTLIPVKFNRIEVKNAEPLRIAAAIGK